MWDVLLVWYCFWEWSRLSILIFWCGSGVLFLNYYVENLIVEMYVFFRVVNVILCFCLWWLILSVVIFFWVMYMISVLMW